jgi:hypothetical protein
MGNRVFVPETPVTQWQSRSYLSVSATCFGARELSVELSNKWMIKAMLSHVGPYPPGRYSASHLGLLGFRDERARSPLQSQIIVLQHTLDFLPPYESWSM